MFLLFRCFSIAVTANRSKDWQLR